jgi:hypothetical protein
MMQTIAGLRSPGLMPRRTRLRRPTSTASLPGRVKREFLNVPGLSYVAPDNRRLLALHDETALTSASLHVVLDWFGR